MATIVKEAKCTRNVK